MVDTGPGDRRVSGGRVVEVARAAQDRDRPGAERDVGRVAPRDTTGPVVSRISDGPDPIFTAGNKPDTTQINFTISDTSGVATVNVYYRLGSGSFALWATPKPGTASTTFGPFTKTGTYEYRIMATDTLGTTICKTPATCPGGTVTVTTNTKTTTTTTTTVAPRK